MVQRLLMLLSLLGMVFGAAAQDLYKSTMPNGKVVYGEKPEPGAKHVEKLPPPPPKTGTAVLTPAEKQVIDQRMKQRAASEDAWRRELESAHAQLKKAEEAREAGKEPTPGERVGTAVGKGRTRFTDEYWERQKSLEAAVEAARKRVEEVENARR